MYLLILYVFNTFATLIFTVYCKKIISFFFPVWFPVMFREKNLFGNKWQLFSCPLCSWKSPMHFLRYLTKRLKSQMCSPHFPYNVFRTAVNVIDASTLIDGYSVMVKTVPTTSDFEKVQLGCIYSTSVMKFPIRWYKMSDG